jgi:hypothetical protein
MASPFPGMDPYLEGYLWQDVHQSLAGQFKKQLNPMLVPLKNEDPDVALDVQEAITAVHDESNYHLTLDYTAPPPRPPLTESENEWLQARLEKVGLR